MLGKRLKNLRKEADITQEQLAKNIGVTTSMVGMYETDARKPSYEVLLKIADCFNISTDYLLGKTIKRSKKEVEEYEKFDEDIRKIERARNKMAPKDKKKMMDILKISFEDYFNSNED